MDNGTLMNQGMNPSMLEGLNSPQNIANQMNTANMPNMKANLSNQVVYPEIYYKLQPHIMMVCDQMDAYGDGMPTQEMVEQTTDNIYDDVVRLYPDVAEYANANELRMNTTMPEAVQTQFVTDFGFGFGPEFGFRPGRFRRRGVLRDVIDILLLQEFLRRRRRPFRF
jgi:hypothetical protein